MRYSNVKHQYDREFSFEMEDSQSKKKAIARGSDVLALLMSVIIMVLGVALVAVGAWLLSSPLVRYLGARVGGSMWYSGKTHEVEMGFIEFASILSIVDGGIVVFFMVLALIGITASKHTAHCFIGAYILCLIFSSAFFISLFVKGIPAQWSGDTAVTFGEALIDNYEGPEGQNRFTIAFNELQVDSKCCGVSDPADIRGPDSFNFTLWTNRTSSLPEPCTSTENGCIDALVQTASLYFVLLVGLATSCLLLQIPALLNALCLCSAS